MTSHEEKLLDDIGWRLLEELQEDARLSYTELGRRVGLSTPAVMERIHKMEDAGIIMGYRAEINPEKIGFHVTAFIRVGLEHDVVPRLGSLFKEIPEIIECHRVTGDDSLIMKVHVTSIVLSTPAPRRRLERQMVTRAAKKTRGSQS